MLLVEVPGSNGGQAEHAGGVGNAGGHPHASGVCVGWSQSQAAWQQGSTRAWLLVVSVAADPSAMVPCPAQTVL